MDELKDFRLRPDDLFVVTYPKSGTTWMQQIVRLIANDGEDDGTIVTEAIPWLEKDYGKVLPSGVKVDEMPSPRRFKSHTPYHMMPGGMPHTSPAKYIYHGCQKSQGYSCFFVLSCSQITVLPVHWGMGSFLTSVHKR